MHYFVCPILHAGHDQGMNGETRVTDKVARDCLKDFYGSKDLAYAAAEGLAKKHPTVQFAVFQPVAVFETLTPPPPPVIRKRITESGEIVVDKGEPA